MKPASKSGKNEVRQLMYVVLAALLCFVGPTYFVAVVSKVIPDMYAMALGFASFVVGVILILRLVRE